MGIGCTARACIEQYQAVNVTLTPESGYTMAGPVEAAQAAIRGLISGLAIGEDLIRYELVRVVTSLTVIYDVAFALPAGDVTVPADAKLLPGTNTVA